ncbi:MAG: hypothetical protein QM323_04200 [Acidobacteriota bacterium]|nr:hypothetical protein [Acidobacteriota bacterium]
MGSPAIDVSGIPETRTLLKRFEPDLLKRLDTRLNAVARELRSGAQAYFERTGASGGAYRVSTRNRIGGFSKAVATVRGSVSRGDKWSTQPGVLAAIFEFMAAPRDAQPQNVPRVRSLIATLNARYGTPGRFLWQTWDDHGQSYLAEIDAEVRAVEAEYTARLRAT